MDLVEYKKRIDSYKKIIMKEPITNHIDLVMHKCFWICEQCKFDENTTLKVLRFTFHAYDKDFNDIPYSCKNIPEDALNKMDELTYIWLYKSRVIEEGKEERMTYYDC